MFINRKIARLVVGRTLWRRTAVRDRRRAGYPSYALTARQTSFRLPSPSTKDQVHRAYDPGSAQRFRRVRLQVDRVLKRFRSL